MKINSELVGHSKTNLSYFHSIGDSPLVYRTIGQQLSIAAKTCGDRDAFIFVEEGKRITYGELLEKTNHLAAGLNCLGLEKGDCVGILTPNVSTWPIAAYATARAGLINVNLNPVSGAQEIEACLRKVSAKVLIASEKIGPKDYYDVLLEVIPELGSYTSGIIKNEKWPFLSNILIDSEKHFPGTRRLMDVMKLPTTTQVQNIEDCQADISPDSGYTIYFTSGFTGNPKAVLLSHFASLNTGFHYNHEIELENKRSYLLFPFCHVTGGISIAITSLCNNMTIVVPSGWINAEKIICAIAEEKCDYIHVTPTLFMALLSKQKELQLDIQVTNVICGVTHGSPELYNEMRKVFKAKSLMMAVGMTEYSGICTLSHPNDSDELIMETVGHIRGHLEAKVIDDKGNIVPFGTPGEFCIRGYAVMNGYWEDDVKTKEVLGSDGWLKTGDYVTLDQNGYVRVIGRLSDLISKGNDKIFPKDIELLLETCPAIQEACIVGIPDKHWGEELCAFIRLQNGFDSFSTIDLHDFCQNKIPSFIIPPYVRIVTDFPRTISGKVKKPLLKQQF